MNDMKEHITQLEYKVETIESQFELSHFFFRWRIKTKIKSMKMN